MEEAEERLRQSFREEIDSILTKSQKDHDALKRTTDIKRAGMCAVGIHQTDKDIFFCKLCNRSFCEEHGDIKKKICNECQGI